MTITAPTTPTGSADETAVEHVDVLIVGAGLSGIGAACHLQTDAPGTTYALLEARGASGGTWDLFRYPGIRSDSDMFTLGYGFRPWDGTRSIADGDAILSYIRATASAYGVDEQIRYHRKVERADWSSEDARWTVTVAETGPDVEAGAAGGADGPGGSDGPGGAGGADGGDGAPAGRTSTLTCSFLYLCSGYYSYDAGYTPDWPGRETFRGEVVHPQHWPDDLDLTGKRVVVVGSGATAVTLVPALAGTAEHVTMLQRSPSYVLSLPDADPVGDLLRRLLPAGRARAAIRWKNVRQANAIYQLSRRYPERMRALLRRSAVRQLPAGYDVDTHFRPTYDPWDQRMCIAPQGDLFTAIRSGDADVVTDHIEAFTPDGIRLRSGAVLPADVVVAATGLELLPLGGIPLSVDGEDVAIPERVAYKGMMLDGVPNLAFALGYTNASWTLKVDLVSAWVARLLAFMARQGHAAVVPQLPGREMETAPFVEMTSGYFERSRDALPRQGDRAPWRLQQQYTKDAGLFRGSFEDGTLQFRPRPADDGGVGSAGRRSPQQQSAGRQSAGRQSAGRQSAGR